MHYSVFETKQLLLKSDLIPLVLCVCTKHVEFPPVKTKNIGKQIEELKNARLSLALVDLALRIQLLL